MQKYVLDLFSTDKIAEEYNSETIVIDRILAFEDTAIIDGYYEDTGDEFIKEFSLDEIVWIRY